MTKIFRPHPDKPALHNGAIDFYADHGTAVISYRLTPDLENDPPVTIRDMHDHDTVDGWETLEDIADAMGHVVYPDLASYRQSRGWHFTSVLLAAGVDPEAVEGLLADADEVEVDDHWREDAAPHPYDFSLLPPAGDDDSPDAPPAAGPPSRAVQFTPEQHAAAWAAYMLEHTPRGFETFKGPHGWGWRRAGRGFELPTVTDTRAEIAAGIRKGLDEAGITPGVNIVVEPHPPTWAEARAAAWAAYLADDARVVLDVLQLASVWSTPLDESGLWPADLHPEVALQRAAWVEGWTLLERGLATRWAAAVHVGASDNDDVEIPPRPECVDRDRPT